MLSVSTGDLPSAPERIQGYIPPRAAKLSNAAASGEPEDQRRAPMDALLADLAALAGFAPGAIVAVGGSSLSDLRTRPDCSARSKVHSCGPRIDIASHLHVAHHPPMRLHEASHALAVARQEQLKL